MSSLVLARKYRPRSFGEMVGQEHVVQARHTPQGSAVMPPCPSGPMQLRLLARMRETVVLPTPRVPVNR